MARHHLPKCAPSTATIAGVLMLLVASNWVGSEASAQSAMAQSGKPSGVGANSANLALPPLDALPQTRARPLFTPSRRPPVSAVPAPAPPPAAVVQAPAPSPTRPADQLVLTGIVSGQDTRVAVLRDAQTSEIHRAQRGEKVIGWSVVEIEPRSVLLRKEGKTLKLELFPDVKR
jgi:hypothetical protein